MRKQKKKRHCGHKIVMRVKRARHVASETSAQGVALQLYAIFSVLVWSMPLRRDLGTGSSSGSVSGSGEPVTAPVPPREIYMTGDDAMTFIRRHKPTHESARLIAAKTALMREIPEAADWIKYAFDYAEWSDLLRCDVPGNLPATSRAMQVEAGAWRLERKRGISMENTNKYRL